MVLALVRVCQCSCVLPCPLASVRYAVSACVLCLSVDTHCGVAVAEHACARSCGCGCGVRTIQTIHARSITISHPHASFGRALTNADPPPTRRAPSAAWHTHSGSNNTLAASCDLCLSVGVHEELDHNGCVCGEGGGRGEDLGEERRTEEEIEQRVG